MYQDLNMNPTNEQRRQLLRTSLELAGRPEDYENIVELLSPPPDILNYRRPGDMKSIRIGIIGGGMAGLCAAFELRKLGAEITVFDAQRDRIGGRVYTYYFDSARRYYGEFGAVRIPVSHETTWHYLNLFRLQTESMAAPRGNNFIYAHGTRIRREMSGRSITDTLYPLYPLTETERLTPWPELSKYATNTMLLSLSPETRTEILKILPAYSTDYADITRLSTRQVFELLGLSQGFISLLSAVEPLTGALINSSHDEVMGSVYSMDFVNVYRVDGGMVNLPLAFYHSLTHPKPSEYGLPPEVLGSVSIQLGYAVKGISLTPGGEQVVLRYSRPDNREEEAPFDYVVCAIPFSTLREVTIEPFFSNQKMQAIRELNYSDALKSLILCSSRFWEEDAPYGRMNGGISFTDLPIQSILYPPDHIRCPEQEYCGPDTPGVLTGAYNIGQDATRVGNQDIFRRFEMIKENIREVHGLPPDLLNSLIMGHKTVEWNAQHWFRSAFAVNGPGQKVNFSYAMQQPEYGGRIFFAGEHVSVKQGWIQGALYSAMLAANQLAMHGTL